MHHGRAKINENIFISLMPHNLLMQIESPNNILHISVLTLNLLLKFGCVENGEMFDDVK
jgi:hypothetical protein